MLLNFKHNSGFTLIELMVTIAVLAILIMIAAPSFQTMVTDNVSSTQVNELVVSLHQARIEAIKKHRNVVMCASENQIRCNSANVAVTAADKDNWEGGWIVQLASEESKDCSVVSCAYIQQKISFAGANTIKSVNFASAANGRVIFDRMGNVVNPGGTFVICDHRGATSAKAVIVSITGYSKFTEEKLGGTSSDIVNDNAGVDVSCP